MKSFISPIDNILRLNLAWLGSVGDFLPGKKQLPIYVATKLTAAILSPSKFPKEFDNINQSKNYEFSSPTWKLNTS